jgi:hypothetical protein
VSVNLDAHTRPELSDRVAIFKAAQDANLDAEQMAALLDLPYTAQVDTGAAGGRSLSAAEVSQKVYLVVANGVLSVAEARAMVAAAGARLEANPDLTTKGAPSADAQLPAP